MKTYTIELSDDATAMLEEAQLLYQTKPEIIIRLCVESITAQAVNDKDLMESFTDDDPEAAVKRDWDNAYDLFQYF